MIFYANDAILLKFKMHILYLNEGKKKFGISSDIPNLLIEGLIFNLHQL